MHRILLFPGQWYALYSYGFMLVMGMVCGVALSRARARRFGLDPDQIVDAALAILIGALIMARVVEVAEDWHLYAGRPWQVLNLRGGGLSWHGGVLGGFLGLMWFVRRSGIHWLVLTDLFLPGVVVGHILGRIGCFLNGCCLGVPCSLPWGVVFKDAVEIQPMVPRHPTQLYEVVCESLALLLVLAWERRVRARGSLFCVYLCLYAVERFVIELWREDAIPLGPLSLAQGFSILLLVLGGVGLYRTLHSPGATDPAPGESGAGGADLPDAGESAGGDTDAASRGLALSPPGPLEP